jgi:hypothetical protein
MLIVALLLRCRPGLVDFVIWGCWGREEERSKRRRWWGDGVRRWLKEWIMWRSSMVEGCHEVSVAWFVMWSDGVWCAWLMVCDAGEFGNPAAGGGADGEGEGARGGTGF